MGWKSAGGGGTDLTTKGDVHGYDTGQARIPVGSNDQVLTADSTAGLGLKWADPTGGGGGASGVFVGARITDPADADQALGVDTLTLVTFDTVDFDTGGFADLGVDDDRLTISEDGKYLIGGTVGTNASSGNRLDFRFYKNGLAGTLLGGIARTEITVANQTINSSSTLEDLVAGDYVSIAVSSEDGADLFHTTGSPVFWIQKVDEGQLLAGYSPILDHKPTTDTLDDEFDSTTLDAKWTAVSGSVGTVNLLETGNVSKYDLTTRPGWVLMQAGSAGTEVVELLQDITLADGESVIAAFAPAALTDVAIANNELLFGLSLNGNDTAWDNTTTTGAVQVLFDFDVDLATIDFGEFGGGGMVGVKTPIGAWGHIVYLRITRSTLNYYGSYSMDGSTWVQLGAEALSSAANNIWLFCESRAAYGDPVPIVAVDWIRQGTNGLDPWSHSGLIQLDTIVTRVKVANEGVTTSTTMQDDDELTFPIGANETWIMDAYLIVDGPTGGDIKAGVKGPSGVAGEFTVTGPGTSATTFENATANNQTTAVGTAPTGLPSGTLGVGSETLVEVHSVIRNGATAGDVVIQWAQNTSSGTTRVLLDSYLKAVKH